MADTLEKLSVEDLVKPIEGENPAGSDPEMNPDYINLDAELAKMSGIDYAVVSELAQNILSKESKHLRVASWLTLAWLKLEGLPGLRDGLSVIHQLMENFDELYPEREKMQIKSLGLLNTDKRILSILQKPEVIGADAEALKASQEHLTAIIDLAQKRFKDTSPDLSEVNTLLSGESAGSAESDSSKETEKASKANESPAEEKESPQDEQAQSDGEQSKAADSGVEEDAEKVSEEDEEKEIAIDDEVAELLNPISEKAPTGEDVEKTDDQDVMVEYMALESEMGKFSGNNYEKCVSMCRKMLLDRTKHLRVAIWLLIAWSRVENLNGVKKGFQLLYALMNQYGTDLHPQKESHQTNTFQMLSSESRMKLIENTEVTQANAQTFLDIKQLFDALNTLIEEAYGDNGPRLTSLAGVLEEKEKEANGFLKQQEQKATPEPKPTSQPTSSSSSSAGASTRESRTSTTSSVSSSGSVAARDLELSSDRDADLALKKSIEFYFEEPGGEKKTRKVPQQPSVYGMSRLYRWGSLQLPPAKDNVTQIDPPNEPKQNFIQNMVNSKEYEKLIPEIEVNFLNRADFLYWLDAQKFVAEALEANGEATKEAAEEIKVHLARLIKRYPDLPKLMFKDKKTPFASQETLNWIEEEVEGVLGSGKAQEKILPPIIGEDYQEINDQYEKACEELPDNFEQNLKKMQESVSGDVRPKGRFLRLLNTANYCYTAKQYSLARVLFQELVDKIDEYNIIEWERALCVSVWQSLYLNNAKLLAGDISEKQQQEIENQQELVYERIAKYDSVLALSLINRTQTKGE